MAQQQGTYVSRGEIDPPTRERTGVGFKKAREDVEWFYASGDSAMGFRAQGYEAGDGGVWDDERLATLHARHLVGTHVDDVEKHRRIATLVAGMSEGSRTVLRAAFEHAISDYHLVTAFADRAGHGSLAGVALLTMAARKAYWRQHDGKVPDRLRMIAFLSGAARKEPKPAYFGAIATEARTMVREALAEYDAKRRERERLVVIGELDA